MIDDRNEYERTKAWLKANQVSSDNRVFNDHRYAIVASCYPYFYLLSLSQRVWNITTAMGNYISSMMKKKMRYGESINADS
ncbi:MAG: hypothetical protein VXZ21_01100 [Bacteroidota bacterium]|nr:hypothetical protein [Bacteroidota bacterium]